MLGKLFSTNIRDLKHYYRASFYETSNLVNNWKQIYDLFSLKDKVEIEIANLIKPYSIPFSTNLKELKKILGKPNYSILKNLKINSYNIYFYNRNIANTKSVIQLHFHNNYLFLVCITYFNDPTDVSAKKAIINNLIEKGANISYKEGTEYVFLDTQNNKLFFDDLFYLRLISLTGNKEVVGDLFSNLKPHTQPIYSHENLWQEISDMVFSISR